MPNLLALAGAQAQKQVRFAPIYTGRWSSGIWTNRSPLRDANTTRLVEKFYGPAGDALIAGINTEITNRLTLARRPGNSVYDENIWTDPIGYYSFKTFGLTTEQIYVMVDQADGLYSLYQGDKNLVWEKSSGAGQSYMQSVGNSLYFGNGADNKKWLQTDTVWSAGFDWTTGTTPAFSTFLIDTNGNIQQLTTQGISGGTSPVWNPLVPSASNNFQGGVTFDGTAAWANRGLPVENWGINPPTGFPVATIAQGGSGWQSTTFYSKAGVVLDSNGNLQQITAAGLSGAVTPTWGTDVGDTTRDGAVVWTMIDTASNLNWHGHQDYVPGDFIVANGCLFQVAPASQPTISGQPTAYLYPGDSSGQFTLAYPTTLGSSTGNSQVGNSLTMQAPSGGQPMVWFEINGAGETIGSPIPFPGTTWDYMIVLLASISVPQPGQYTLSIDHHDGILLGVGGGAQQVSGNLNDPLNNTLSATQGYPLMCSNNNKLSKVVTETCVVNFPSAGVYPIEIDYGFGHDNPGASFHFFVNGNTLVPPPVESGSVEPVWPGWSTTLAPLYPTVSEGFSGQITWQNLGPITDYVWAATTSFTLPSTSIIDSQGNTEFPYRAGISGTVVPTFMTGINQLTPDAPNLIWINQGPVTTPAQGTVSAFNGGFTYWIALVNTLDQTVSNCGPASPSTGNFVGAPGIILAPGSGLPPLNQIDPQADYVAIFRTADGGSVPLLIPGPSIPRRNPNGTLTSVIAYTLPLSAYISGGYIDSTPDYNLNIQLQGAISGQNTPPGTGASNLAFHLNRIFYSIGNVVYWTSGPDTPIGNGVNGTSPLNFDVMPSLVKRIVPTGVGALVFTVSDIYQITGLGTSTSPIQGALPFLTGIGISSYNAICTDGSIIGFFTTDSQFIILDPSAGVVTAGFPIGDQFRKNNGLSGTSWDPSQVYVTVHTDGEDHAFYVADGRYGWFRLMPTPAPEVGYTWSPFAQIVNGAGAVESIEVTPGVHRLLVGPLTTGPLLRRDLDVFSDNGLAYVSNATIGSMVLAQPGQVAAIGFITTDSVKIGTPLTLGLLISEAYPYYDGPAPIILKIWEPDPPTLRPSRSILGQRFYTSEIEDEAPVCRHMQVQVNFSQNDKIQNELLSLTIYGGFYSE